MFYLIVAILKDQRGGMRAETRGEITNVKPSVISYQYQEAISCVICANKKLKAIYQEEKIAVSSCAIADSKSSLTI